MKNSKKESLLKALCIAFALFGGVLAVDAIALLFISNIDLGIILTLLLGLGIILLSLNPKNILSKIPKLIKLVLVSGISIAILLSSALIIYGNIETVTYNEDVLIVLGAGIKGEEPTLTLKNRLNSALEYFAENPDAMIIVSGGQGPQEDITEAEAMERYLLSYGVPKEKIIKEQSSFSTFTNFKFSKEILNALPHRPQRVAFITSEFHIFRGELCAKANGIKAITHKASKTELSYIVSASLRECLAVFKFAIFGN